MGLAHFVRGWRDDGRGISQCSVQGRHFSADRLLLGPVLVNELAESIRQTKYRGTQRHAETIRNPLAQKINSRLAFVPHVGANIQKIVGGHGPEEPGSECARSEERRVGKECRSRWSP